MSEPAGSLTKFTGIATEPAGTIDVFTNTKIKPAGTKTKPADFMTKPASHWAEPAPSHPGWLWVMPASAKPTARILRRNGHTHSETSAGWRLACHP
jgi:hypothetical protein